MSLRRWIPLRLVDDLLDAGNFPIVGVGQKPDIIAGIGRQHLSHGAELGGKIGVSEKKSHTRKRDIPIKPAFKRKPEI